jgi:predicted enzyme related to lactoylglutathione lyase
LNNIKAYPTMLTETITAIDATQITGVPFVSAYVDDFATAFAFYSEVLGLEKQYDMGEHACFFKLGGDWGLYLEGDNTRQDVLRDTARATFTLGVQSAHAMFDKLTEAGVKIVHNEPMDMGQGDFWFQFYDPSGNILEILGGK